MIREYTVNPPMPRIMVQPEELPILTNGFFSFSGPVNTSFSGIFLSIYASSKISFLLNNLLILRFWKGLNCKRKRESGSYYHKKRYVSLIEGFSFQRPLTGNNYKCKENRVKGLWKKNARDVSYVPSRGLIEGVFSLISAAAGT